MSDLINREELLSDLRSLRDTAYRHNTAVYLSTAVSDFISMVAREQKVDAEPVRHGKWIIGLKFGECYNVQCDQCKTIQVLYYGKKVTRYCPECGAKMDGETDVTD